MAQLERDAEDIFATDVAAAAAASPMMAHAIAEIENEEYFKFEDADEGVLASYLDALPKSNKAPPQAKADYRKFVASACSVVVNQNQKESRYVNVE